MIHQKWDTPEENQQQIKALYERSPEFQNIMSSQQQIVQ